MKRNIPVPVFVLALLIGQLSCIAQPPVNTRRPVPVEERVPAELPQVAPLNPVQDPLQSPIRGPVQGQMQNSIQGQIQDPAQGRIYSPNQGPIPSLIPSKYSLRKFAPIRTGDAAMPEGSFNGFAQIRSNPDLGAPGSSGNGYHHFSLPFDKYTSWYRPRAATLTQYQRCAPDPFRPRGFGHLFARPADGYRMEYEPYTLADEPSKYGPSYFARMPDPRCNSCCLCQDDCECECEQDCDHEHGRRRDRGRDRGRDCECR